MNAGLLADAADPLVAAGWLVAGPPGPTALKAPRIDIVAPSRLVDWIEQASVAYRSLAIALEAE